MTIAGSTKCKPGTGARNLNCPSTRGPAGCHSRTVPHCRVPGWSERSPSRRAVGVEMGRRGLRSQLNPHTTIGGQAAYRATKDRSVAKTHSDGSRNGELTVAMEARNALSSAVRLGIRKPGEEGQTSVLAQFNLSGLHQAAADRIGIKKSIGWHTFRHTFGTLLNANGENPKVIQELLRHANLRVTMDTYVQAVSDEKRNAQKKVVRMLLPGIGRNMP